jgi:hypothetical protein
MAGPLVYNGGYIQPFTQNFGMCISDSCGTMTITDLTDFVTVNYVDLVSVTIEVTYGGYTTGVLDITSDYLSALTGSVTTTGTNNYVTGTGTLFLSECQVGNYIVIESTNEAVKIVSISTDTLMTVAVTPTGVANDNAYALDPYIEIAPTDLGLVTFNEGLWEVTMVITTGTNTYTKTKQFYNTCAIECCVYDAVAKIADAYTCNPCDNEFIVYAQTLKALYDSLLYNAAKFNFTEADRILALLQTICVYKNCNCT